MKLYLASYRLGEYPEKFKDLLVSVTKNKKVALITNALDFTNNYFELTKSVQRDKRDIEALGLEVEQVDLREYFGKTDDLRKKMSEFNAVYVRGGNVFVLRRAFAESGFDVLLYEWAERDDFVYAGFSAGVCVLSPDLSGLELVDDPEIDPDGYKPGFRITTGLRLIEFSVTPHFRSDHPESQKINSVVDYYLNHAVVFVALTDNDVLILEAKKVK
ncbi:Type 1 glutamine amidotransferase-like domain-containing protein [Candidatus Woesebacteria bacterium]|nr:Type 1 glutamine amidotransferase-like domain-containing protein [Candidatus Woesebacteria bacterium]